MAQDYSDEWRKALTERDMAVRAIAEFLASLGHADAEQKSFEVCHFDNHTRIGRPVPSETFPQFDNLRQIVAQFKPKALR